MSPTPWASTRSSPVLPVWWHHSTAMPPSTVSAPGCRLTGLRSSRWARHVNNCKSKILDEIAKLGCAAAAQAMPARATPGCRHTGVSCETAVSIGSVFMEYVPPQHAGAASTVPNCLPLWGVSSTACTHRRPTLLCKAAGSCIQCSAASTALSASAPGGWAACLDRRQAFTRAMEFVPTNQCCRASAFAAAS